MSDQTPNSTEDLNGSEPSMEDILASIRKIISEDEPVALESPEDLPPTEIAPIESVNTDRSSEIDAVLSEFGEAPSQNLISDAIESEAETFAAEGDSVDLNINDVLAELDADTAESDHVLSAETTVRESLLSEAPEATSEDIGFEADDDILAFLDNDLLDEGPTETLGGQLDNVETLELNSSDTPTESTESIFESLEPTQIEAERADEASLQDESDLDAVLDDILSESDDESPDFTSEEAVEPEQDFVSEEQSDLDLVKALMADLADDPGPAESDDELNALLEIPDIEETTAELSEPGDETAQSVIPEADVSASESEDILGDILDMTLEDELEAHDDDLNLENIPTLDDVLAAEQDNILENMTEAEPDQEAPDVIEEIAADTEDAPLSLAEIAAAAETDAVAVETASAAPVAAAGLAAAATLGVAAASAEQDATDDLSLVDDLATITDDAQLAELVGEDTRVDESHFDPSEDINELQTQSLSNQETSMPVKAVKTETIIDEVTETAAAGAFAELNQVVEDQAIFNERGPRIGDLVQEALRPMLKEWLDENLKGIVERAVTKEVKRISKGQ